MTGLGYVTIVCPGCHRPTTFTLYVTGPYTEGTDLVTGYQLDMDAVTAHLLTHSQHDGEPLPAAA